MRHVADRGRPTSELTSYGDPFQARILAQTTADGAHRPLKTSPNLQGGWCFEGLDERGLWTVLDYLYPAAVPHWHAGREGTLRVTHWSETAGRQSGIYSAVRLLPPDAVRDAVRACCNDAVCLRRVAWGMSPEEPTPLDSEGIPGSEAEELQPERKDAEAPGEAERVPCPEACSMFISFARAALQVERSPRTPVEGLGCLNALEREQIVELVETAGGLRDNTAREGEFELPLNQRRLRYLALRMRSLRRSEEG